MPLLEASLSSALKAEFDKYPDTINDAATNLANAYGTWASAGMFGVNTIGTITSLQTALHGALLSGFGQQTMASFAQAWVTGLTAWAGVPVVGTNAGAVISCPGAASLASSIPSIFVEPYPETTQDAADLLASLLFPATMTCTALLANVPPTPPTIVVPIS